MPNSRALHLSVVNPHSAAFWLSRDINAWHRVAITLATSARQHSVPARVFASKQPTKRTRRTVYIVVADRRGVGSVCSGYRVRSMV